MHVLLVPIGSAGDVHPLIGLGAALPARGHAVTAVVSEQFEPLARQMGFETVRFGTTAEFESLSGDPDIWNPRKGVELIARMVVDRTSELCRIVRDRARARETVIVAGALAFGARIAQEIDGVPLVTVQLQPVCFRSEFESPILLPWLGDLADWPRPLKRLLFRLANVAMDRIVGPSLNRFRGSLGLAPASQFYDVWWNSPEAIVGFFPEWFARPQPDWPRQLVCAGFPRSDESAVREMPAAVEDFLTAGPPPVVFTPGSAMRHGASFFDASVSACERLGYRGLLLTPFTAQVPARLPAQVLHADYVPLGQLLPRCRALAHHGGIGTLAQGLAAGVPQLVMPMAYDQPDNAARLRRLGVGRSLRPAGYRGPAVAEALAELTTDAQVAAACARAAELIRADRPLDVACDVVERLARSHCSATATPSPAPAQDRA